MDNFPRSDAQAADPIGDVDGRSGTDDANARAVCVADAQRRPDAAASPGKQTTPPADEPNGRKVNGEKPFPSRDPNGRNVEPDVSQNQPTPSFSPTLCSRLASSMKSRQDMHIRLQNAHVRRG